MGNNLVRDDGNPGDEGNRGDNANPGDDDPGDDNPGDNDPGHNNPGDDNPGDGDPGDDDPGDDDPGDDDPGDESDIEGSDFEEVDEYFALLKYLSKEWLKVELAHRVSKVASEEFWSLAKKWFHKLFTTKKVQKVTRKTPSFPHLRRRMYDNSVPPIHMEFGFLEKDTGDLTIVEDTPITPKKQFPPHRFQKIWEIAHVKVTLFVEYIVFI